MDTSMITASTSSSSPPSPVVAAAVPIQNPLATSTAPAPSVLSMPQIIAPPTTATTSPVSAVPGNNSSSSTAVLPTLPTNPFEAVPAVTADPQQQQVLWQQVLQTLAAVQQQQQQLLAPPALQQQILMAAAPTSFSSNVVPQPQQTPSSQPLVPAPSAKTATKTKQRPTDQDIFGSAVVSLTSKDLDALSPIERRRYERNLREQQRSYKISQQIKQLRDVLQESNVPFRPNKYSILVSVAEYIQQLQARAVMLDAEHQRLINTIRETNDTLRSGASLDSNGATASDNPVVSEQDSLFVEGIAYDSVFSHCPYPLGVATLDGRILLCNRSFQNLLNVDLEKDDGSPSSSASSFFVYIRNHQQVFEAMAALLKRSTTMQQQELLYWCGKIQSHRNETFPFTITLTNSAEGNPKYFSLSASVTTATTGTT